MAAVALEAQETAAGIVEVETLAARRAVGGVEVAAEKVEATGAEGRAVEISAARSEVEELEELEELEEVDEVAVEEAEVQGVAAVEAEAQGVAAVEAEAAAMAAGAKAEVEV